MGFPSTFFWILTVQYVQSVQKYVLPFQLTTKTRGLGRHVKDFAAIEPSWGQHSPAIELPDFDIDQIDHLFDIHRSPDQATQRALHLSKLVVPEVVAMMPDSETDEQATLTGEIQVFTVHHPENPEVCHILYAIISILSPEGGINFQAWAPIPPRSDHPPRTILFFGYAMFNMIILVEKVQCY